MYLLRFFLNIPDLQLHLALVSLSFLLLKWPFSQYDFSPISRLDVCEHGVLSVLWLKSAFIASGPTAWCLYQLVQNVRCDSCISLFELAFGYWQIYSNARMIQATSCAIFLKCIWCEGCSPNIYVEFSHTVRSSNFSGLIALLRPFWSLIILPLPGRLLWTSENSEVDVISSKLLESTLRSYVFVFAVLFGAWPTHTLKPSHKSFFISAITANLMFSCA